jgi:hypothetical protein
MQNASGKALNAYRHKGQAACRSHVATPGVQTRCPPIKDLPPRPYFGYKKFLLRRDGFSLRLCAQAADIVLDSLGCRITEGHGSYFR